MPASLVLGVSQLGGRLEVESTRRVGSTFRVVLPAAPRDVASAAA